MPKFNLLIKCDLENLKDLIPDEDTRWYLKFKCTNCHEETSKWVYISSQEQHQHGRGSFNLLYQCPFCKRDHTVDVVKTFTYSSSGAFAPIAVFECRGVVPIAYDPRIGWTATHPVSGKVFICDLSEDFADYDDEENEPVGVYKFQSRFE